MKRWILATDRELFMKKLWCLSGCARKLIIIGTQIVLRENHARHTILKIATPDQLQRKFSYNHCLIIILLKLREL